MLTVCIQAGGESARMGEDKALKKFLGRPLIQRVFERLQPIADELIVTTNRPEDFSFLDARLIPDLKPGRGALGGLYTAIASASHPLVAVIACDLPFANASLIEASTKIIDAENVDLVIAKGEEGYEPLHALYRRATCLPVIESAINSDQWRVVSWLPQVNVRVLTASEIKSADSRGLAFWNVNTPEEFAQAEAIANNQNP
ncbi:MAG: molybdenum cofactor guanylyltransferase [Anaerolineales bacterium]|nr:MAG: molybdenum cofactor guanylyltransferase [Anaerolineales bacterium]